MYTTNHMYIHNPTNEPGIDFDEVQAHRVWARGQHERLFDGMILSLDTVTTADVSKLATCGDFAAVPALKIIRVVEQRHCCQKNAHQVARVWVCMWPGMLGIGWQKTNTERYVVFGKPLWVQCLYSSMVTRYWQNPYLVTPYKMIMHKESVLAWVRCTITLSIPKRAHLPLLSWCK